jgi:hypothetical protein
VIYLPFNRCYLTSGHFNRQAQIPSDIEANSFHQIPHYLTPQTKSNKYLLTKMEAQHKVASAGVLGTGRGFEICAWSSLFELCDLSFVEAVIGMGHGGSGLMLCCSQPQAKITLDCGWRFCMEFGGD